jgi:Flp pilus assembly protein TadD
MSLLMDALKKAELAKRQGQGETAGDASGQDATAGLMLEPMADSSPPASASAENLSPEALASRLEEIDTQFLAEAREAAAARLKAQATAPAPAPAMTIESPAAPAGGKQQRRARQVHARPAASANGIGGPARPIRGTERFCRKAGRPAATAEERLCHRGRSTLGSCGLRHRRILLVAVAAENFARRQPVAAARHAGTQAVTPPAAVPPAPTIAAAPGAPTAAPATGASTAPGPGVPAAADKEDDDVAPTAAKAPTAPRRTRPAPVAEPDADSPVRVTKAPLKVNPALLRGFDAFNRGDLEQAQLEYERAQKSDPRNTDALHGLAAIAVRQGRHEQADLLYRRITEADPQDTVAMSALINNRSQIDPGAAESRLKSLSAAQPDLAAPQFALGNLYARQGRWNEAQQAYFRAYNAEQDNPDILYNLAISLEHMRQNKLAAQYYSPGYRRGAEPSGPASTPPRLPHGSRLQR